jgi:hydrogenase nickel incorporation protein HypA/HybF
MHEMSLAESVLNIIEDAARNGKFDRVMSVTLEIGALSAVEPDAMRFCFEAVTNGTFVQGAKLEIVELPGLGFCRDCNKTVTLAERYGLCPECNGTHIAITGGETMRVKEISVE